MLDKHNSRSERSQENPGKYDIFKETDVMQLILCSLSSFSLIMFLKLISLKACFSVIVLSLFGCG